MTEHSFTNYFAEKPLHKTIAVLAASVALASCARSVEGSPVAEAPIPSTQTTTETPPPAPETTPPAVTSTPETTIVPADVSSAVDCMVERCIALTFDDGPGPYTEQLLKDLNDHGAKATFFMVGTQVQRFPSAAKDVAAAGEQIGNHSWNHDDLTTLGASAAAADIAKTNNLITETTGVTPEVMRPPYGSTNTSIINAVGMPEMLWSVDTEDWKYPDSDYVANYVASHAERGDIILMHDIHPTTVDAVPRILDDLQSKGYKLVTVDTLLGSNLPAGKYSQQKGIS